MTLSSNGYVPSERATIIASVSGGKDSTAMLLHLRELGLLARTRAVFFDVGWDHADTYAHVDYLERTLGIHIERHAATIVLRPELEQDALDVEEALGLGRQSAFVRLCLQKGIFPRRTIRFCTQELKVFVARRVIRTELQAGGLVVNAVGIRAAESAARAKMSETEISTTLDCLVWRPLIGWSEDDVVAIHRRHGIRLNPLYLRGAGRVGCWPCIMSNKTELRMIGKDQQRIHAIRMLEERVRLVYRRRNKSDGEPEERLPTFFQASRKDIAGNRYGHPIDDIIAWARTSRGGSVDQMTLMDDPEDENAGCMRWGMCEQSP